MKHGPDLLGNADEIKVGLRGCVKQRQTGSRERKTKGGAAEKKKKNKGGGGKREIELPKGEEDAT